MNEKLPIRVRIFLFLMTPCQAWAWFWAKILCIELDQGFEVGVDGGPMKDIKGPVA